MKEEKLFIFVSVLLAVTGIIFIIKEPLGAGKFTDVKLWSNIFGLWSSNFVFFHIGAAYQRKKKERKTDEER